VRERGQILWIVAIIVAFVFIAGLLAICTPGENDHSLGRPRLVSHYDDGGDCDWEGDCGGQDYDQNYGSRDDRNRNRNRNRGAFSPGPFDRSPIDFSGSCISLNCSGRDDRNDRKEQR
jgi:hypothetical protein